MHATYRTETLDKMERSSFLDSEVALLNQLVAEIGANRPTWQLKFPNLRTTEGRPRKYYWTDKTEAEEIDEAEEARSEENTYEIQSRMSISYAVLCLKKKKQIKTK